MLKIAVDHLEKYSFNNQVLLVFIYFWSRFNYYSYWVVAGSWYMGNIVSVLNDYYGLSCLYLVQNITLYNNITNNETKYVHRKVLIAVRQKPRLTAGARGRG